MTVVSTRLSPRAGLFARAVQAIAAGGGEPEGAARFAQRFTDTPDLAEFFRKSGEPGVLGTSPTASWTTAPPGSVEFSVLLAQHTVIGRLQGLRRIPFYVTIASQADLAGVFWVGEARPVPIAVPPNFLDVRLEPRKICGIVPLSQELVRARGPAAEAAISETLLAAATRMLDDAFLNPAAAEVTEISPASITFGLGSLSSAGDPASDVQQLVAATELDLTDAVLLMAPDVAVAAAASLLGAGTGLGVRGGTLFGLPVLTSKALADNVVLVHASRIALAEDPDVAVDVSEQATLEMTASPTQDGTEGTGAQLVSLWQTNSAAIRLTRSINWERTHNSTVLLVSGVEYGAGS
jgi:hypothetical protein